MYLFIFFVYHILWIRFKDVQLQIQQNPIYNDASYSYNNGNQYGKISPSKKDEIKVVGTNPALN